MYALASCRFVVASMETDSWALGRHEILMLSCLDDATECGYHVLVVVLVGKLVLGNELVGEDNMNALFPQGLVTVSDEVRQRINSKDVQESLRRHASGDWGSLRDEDILRNERALKEGGKLLSVYVDSASQHYWIVTSPDRTTTRVILPTEYTFET